MAEHDNFTAKIMDDMPDKLLDFVKLKVTSFIKWDLIRFFYENPNTVDTADNIARYAGRSINAVEPELEELEMSGIMQRRLIGDQIVFSLTDNTETRQTIAEFVRACEDRQFRVKAVYHIIRGMQ